jgi:hypothetical protein
MARARAAHERRHRSAVIRRRLSPTSALCIAFFAATHVARADVPQEDLARREFEGGVALEKKGDYVEALARFRASAQLKPTLGNRFHTAYCLEMTGKLAVALEEYEAVEKDARELKKTDVALATHARLEALRPRVPEVSIHPMSELHGDLEVVLDDAPLLRVVLDGRPFHIDPGEHTLTAWAPSYRPFSTRIAVAEGATTSVDIVLEREQKPSSLPVAVESQPRPFPSPPPAPAPRRDRLARITTVGAAALTAASGLAFLAAGTAQTSAEDTCPKRLTCDDERSKVRTLDAFALAGFISAAGLAAVSVVLWTSQSTRRAATSFVVRASFVHLEQRF